MKHKARLAHGLEPNPQMVSPPTGAGADFYNASHYADPTAWQAIERIAKQEQKEIVMQPTQQAMERIAKKEKKEIATPPTQQMIERIANQEQKASAGEVPQQTQTPEKVARKNTSATATPPAQQEMEHTANREQKATAKETPRRTQTPAQPAETHPKNAAEQTSETPQTTQTGSKCNAEPQPTQPQPAAPKESAPKQNAVALSPQNEAYAERVRQLESYRLSLALVKSLSKQRIEMQEIAELATLALLPQHPAQPTQKNAALQQWQHAGRLLEQQIEANLLLQRQLSRLIDRLAPGEVHQILRLVYINGLPVAEAAHQLQRSPKQGEVLLRRAVQALNETT